MKSLPNSKNIVNATEQNAWKWLWQQIRYIYFLTISLKEMSNEIYQNPFNYMLNE